MPALFDMLFCRTRSCVRAALLEVGRTTIAAAAKKVHEASHKPQHIHHATSRMRHTLQSEQCTNCSMTRRADLNCKNAHPGTTLLPTAIHTPSSAAATISSTAR
jgi:hypothetical protein